MASTSTSTFPIAYPSPNEVQGIESRIYYLRNEVKQAQEIIKCEEARIAKLEKEIEGRLAIIAPIQKIPLEILGYIIELHARMEWWAPVLYGRVSRKFRHAVLASPRAWSYPTLEKEKSRRRMTRVGAELWMERAGASPLHVRIHSYDDTLHRPILMRSPEQIVDLKYSGPIINLRKSRLPNLRRLFLSWNSDASTNPFLDDVNGECPMPLLDTLGLWYLIRVPFALTRSFPHITTLYLCDINPGDCGGLVSHCSKTLKTLMLDECETSLISERTDFPVLEFLSVRMAGAMDFISAPKLCVFHEGLAINTPSTSFPSVVEYGSFENEPVVQGTKMEGLDLQRRFPNLQRLSLRERPTIVASALKKLAEHPDIWPHLQLLEAPVTSDAEVERFSDLLAKRNSNANVPIAACWIWPGVKPKVPMRFASVSILLSFRRMNVPHTHSGARFRLLTTVCELKYIDISYFLITQKLY